MKLIAGAILILAGAVLVSAAMLGVDIRNSTGAAPYTESRMGYILGAVVAMGGLLLIVVGFPSDRGSASGPASHIAERRKREYSDASG
jgi:hypothetical protein